MKRLKLKEFCIFSFTYWLLLTNLCIYSKYSSKEIGKGLRFEIPNLGRKCTYWENIYLWLWWKSKTKKSTQKFFPRLNSVTFDDMGRRGFLWHPLKWWNFPSTFPIWTLWIKLKMNRVDGNKLGKSTMVLKIYKSTKKINDILHSTIIFWPKSIIYIWSSYGHFEFPSSLSSSSSSSYRYHLDLLPCKIWRL